MEKTDQCHRVCELRAGQYCYLLDAMAQGVVYFNSEGKVIWANSAAGRIRGSSCEDLIGSSPFDPDWGTVYTDETPVEPDASPAILTLKTGASIQGMVLGVYNPLENRYRWVKISTIPMFQPEEQSPCQVCATFEDITEEIELRRRLEDIYKRELEFSRMLQRALLPDRLSGGPGYDLKTAYLPAYKSREIGGDIYDVFRTKDGELGILIGDAAGKGIEAVFLASSARSMIRAFAYETSSTSDALSRVSVILGAQQSEFNEYDSFTTILFIIVDPPTGNFRYSVAGHPPALLRRVSGEIEHLGNGEPPICIDPGFQYKERNGQMDYGDKILLYTDGLLDARHGRHFIGEEGVFKIFRQHGHLPPEEIVNKLMNVVERISKDVRTDDVAMIAIERLRS